MRRASRKLSQARMRRKWARLAESLRRARSRTAKSFTDEIGPGLGYHLVKTPAFEFDIEGGANYQVQLRSAGGNLDSVFIRAAEDATWKLTPRCSVSEKYEFFVNAEDFSQYRFRLDSTLSYKLIENLSLNLTLIDLYDTDPAPNVDRNELQIRTSIGITF